jgi:nucleotide-binding universal stress UspA family protein
MPEIRIRSILAPTDFSPSAERALEYACSLASQLGATLHLLHVLSDAVIPVGPDPSLITAIPPEYYSETESQSREALARAIPDTWPQPPARRVEVRWGSAVEGITAYAADQRIDLIVLATHGRTGLSHVLLGSVAEQIVRTAPCPVLTIRRPASG